MTNKTDAEILADAPEGATHVDNNGFYLKASTSGYMDMDEDGRDWDYDYANHCHTRSLADIKALLAKDKKIAELEAVLTRLNNIGGLGLDKHKWIEEALKDGEL